MKSVARILLRMNFVESAQAIACFAELCSFWDSRKFWKCRWIALRRFREFGWFSSIGYYYTSVLYSSWYSSTKVPLLLLRRRCEATNILIFSSSGNFKFLSTLHYSITTLVIHHPLKIAKGLWWSWSSIRVRKHAEWEFKCQLWISFGYSKVRYHPLNVGIIITAT